MNNKTTHTEMENRKKNVDKLIIAVEKPHTHFSYLYNSTPSDSGGACCKNSMRTEDNRETQQKEEKAE